MKLRDYIWILLGLLALFLNWVFGIFPAVYEVFYFRGIFQVIRVVYDYLLGWIPIPMVYFLFFVVVQIIYRFIQFRGVREAESITGKVTAFVLPLFSLAGAVMFFFYFLWGFNYQQESLGSQLDLPEIKVDTIELYDQSIFFLDKMEYLRADISSDSLPLDFSKLPKGYEGDIRENLERVFDAWDLPTYGKVRVRSLYPKGILLRISTAGVYIPFVFEGHIDAGLHPIQYPFTMAHEMSHGYGLADEGTCNFTGFLACMESDEPFIQYSACMSLWRYMANNLRKAAPKSYMKLMKSIPDDVRTDLVAVMVEMDKYPDIFPEVRDAVYDTYLKSHGVVGGLSNYSTVVKMVLSWKKTDNNPQLVSKIFEKEDQ